MSFVVIMAERLVDDPDAEAQTLDQARTQLRMLLVGALNWRSREPAAGDLIAVRSPTAGPPV